MFGCLLWIWLPNIFVKKYISKWSIFMFSFCITYYSWRIRFKFCFLVNFIIFSFYIFTQKLRFFPFSIPFFTDIDRIFNKVCVEYTLRNPKTHKACESECESFIDSLPFFQRTTSSRSNLKGFIPVNTENSGVAQCPPFSHDMIYFT